jgi:hypothetical protein
MALTAQIADEDRGTRALASIHRVKNGWFGRADAKGAL